MSGQCSSCGRAIHWAVTENGKPMPIDPVPAPDGNVVPHTIDGRWWQVVAHVLTADELATHTGERYTSHFATCPNADQHRRP